MTLTKYLLSGMVALALVGTPKATAQMHTHGMRHEHAKSAATPADTTKSAVDTAQAVEATYRCPMHPDVVSDKPGKCPKCGMKLEKVTSTAAPAEHKSHSPSGGAGSSHSTTSDTDSVKAEHRHHDGVSEAADQAGCPGKAGECCDRRSDV